MPVTCELVIPKSAPVEAVEVLSKGNSAGTSRPGTKASAAKPMSARSVRVPSPQGGMDSGSGSLLVSAAMAAKLVSVSKSSWWGYHAAGRCPQAVFLSGRTLWRRAELEKWVEAGCPSRSQWEHDQRA